MKSYHGAGTLITRLTQMSNQCDPEVYQDGTEMFMTNTISSDDMEDWVKMIAADSGQRVDWCYAMGRAHILALGDLNRVKKSILKNRKVHDEGYTKAVREIPGNETENVSRQIDGIWEYNYQNRGLFRTWCSKCPGACLPQNHAGWDPTSEGHG